MIFKSSDKSKKIYSETILDKVLDFPHFTNIDTGKVLSVDSQGELVFAETISSGVTNGASTDITGVLGGSNGKLVQYNVDTEISNSPNLITSKAVYDEFGTEITSDTIQSYINNIAIPDDTGEGKLNFTANSASVKQLLTNYNFKNYDQDWNFNNSSITTFNYNSGTGESSLVFLASAKDGTVQHTVTSASGLYLVVASYKTDSTAVVPYVSGDQVDTTHCIIDTHPGDGNFHTVYYIMYGTINGAGIKDTRESNWTNIEVEYINLFDLTFMGYGVTSEPTPAYLAPYFAKLKSQITTSMNTGVISSTSVMAYTYGINLLKDSFDIPFTNQGLRVYYKTDLNLPIGKYLFYPITADGYNTVSADFTGHNRNTIIDLHSNNADGTNNILNVTVLNDITSVSIQAFHDVPNTTKYISFILIPYDMKSLYDPEHFDSAKFEYYCSTAYIPDLGLNLSANSMIDLNTGKLSLSTKSKVLINTDVDSYAYDDNGNIITIYIKKPLDYLYYNSMYQYKTPAIYCESLFDSYTVDSTPTLFAVDCIKLNVTFASTDEAVHYVEGKTLYYAVKTPTVTNIASVINIKPNTMVYFEPVCKFIAKPFNHIITIPYVNPINETGYTNPIYKIQYLISVTDILNNSSATVLSNTDNTVTLSSDMSDDEYYEVTYKYNNPSICITPITYSYGKNLKYKLNEMGASIVKQQDAIQYINQYLQYNLGEFNTSIKSHIANDNIHVTTDEKQWWDSKQEAVNVVGLLKSDLPNSISKAIAEVDYLTPANYTRAPYYTWDTNTVANAIIITVPNYTAFVDGSRFLIYMKNVNTSTNVTLKINNLTAKYVYVGTYLSTFIGPPVGELNKNVAYEFVYNSSMSSFFVQTRVTDISTFGGKLPSEYQQTLTFDDTPTLNSSNPVTSNGTRLVLNNKIDKTDIVNDTSTGGITKVLSAEQGKILDAKFTNFIKTDLLEQSISGFPLSPWCGFGAGGGLATSGGTYKHPGVWSVSNNSALADSGGGFSTETKFMLSENMKTTIIFKSTATVANITTLMGFHNTANHTAPTNGVYCKIVSGILTGEAISSTASKTTTSSSYTITANTWYRIVIELTSNATSATFTLYADDSTSVLWTNTVSSNIPSSTNMVANSVISTMAPATSQSLILSVDYIDMYYPNARRVV